MAPSGEWRVESGEWRVESGEKWNYNRDEGAWSIGEEMAAKDRIRRKEEFN